MLNKILKIFIYDKNGNIVSENDYSSFIKVLLDTIDHNIQYENDQWNVIHGFEFPPKGLIWNNNLKEWENNNYNIIKNDQLTSFIKSFG